MAIDRIEVDYSAQETFSPFGSAAAELKLESEQSNGVRIVVLAGTRTSRCRFRRAGNLASYETLTEEQPLPNVPPTPLPDITAYASDRVERRFGNNGVIRTAEPLPVDSLIEIALGLRTIAADRWMTDKDWLACELTSWGSELIRLSLRTPEAQRIDTWSFDPSREYVLVEYTAAVARGDAVLKGMEILNSDFREVSGILLPHKVVCRQCHIPAEGKPVVVYAADITVDEYIIGQLQASDDQFLIKWPRGASVLDDRTGRRYVVESEGQQLTDDVLGTINEARRLRGLDELGGRGASRRNWILGLNVTALVVLLLVFFYRRYRRRGRMV